MQRCKPIYPQITPGIRKATSIHYRGNEPSEEPAYIDALARELASESCIRCSGRSVWKTAAMMYEGLDWKYYYCYECRGWFRRHFRYRYAVAPVDEEQVVNLLVRQLESQREMVEAQLSNISWIRRKISAASAFFQKFLP